MIAPQSPSVAHHTIIIMNTYQESLMDEDTPALMYNSDHFMQSPPFHEDRLSTVSSQYSLASQALTNSASVSSPKVPTTPENKLQYAQMFNMPNRLGHPHLTGDAESLNFTYNREQDIYLDNYADKCGVTSYNMADFNMIGDDCWKLDAIPEVSSFTDTHLASLNPDFTMFDGTALTANGSLPVQDCQLELNSHSSELATRRNHLRTFLPYSDYLDRVTEAKLFDSTDKNQKVLRSQKPRCREEKIKFRQERTASKFPAYDDVKELFKNCAAHEISRMREMKTESSVSSPLLPLSSRTGTKRTRRRNQTASKKVTLPSEKLNIEYEAKESKEKFFCPICNKDYSRKEHMERHKRSHFGLDKEKCLVPSCSTIVNRRDNLIQHLSTHVRVNEKGSRRPEKMIPIEGMRLLIRESGGKNAKNMVMRLEAARLKMKMKDYLKIHGGVEEFSNTNVSRSIRNHKVLPKL